MAQKIARINHSMLIKLASNTGSLDYQADMQILPDITQDIVKLDKRKHLPGMVFRRYEQVDVSLVLNSPQKPEK